jgi:hypothetical protein
MLHGVPASGWYGRPDTQLRTDEAHRYARLLHAALGRHWRVEVFHVAQGIATVELRARQRPPRPAVVLRQAGECERVLREGIASRFQSSPGV